MRSILLVFLLLTSSQVFAQAGGSSAAQGKAAAPPEAQAAPDARVLPGEWDLKPLARIGDPAPETGGRFEEFGHVYWLDSGVLVFWARFGPKQWAIYSWKDGRLQLVVPEGNNVQPPHAEGVMEKLDIHRVRGWRYETLLHPGRGVLYLSVRFGALDYTGSIYAWDGEHLRKVLARGDSVSLGGVPHRLRFARVRATASDGTTLIHVQTEQKLEGLALLDGSSVSSIMLEEQELPGIPGVRLKHHALGYIPGAIEFGMMEGDLYLGPGGAFMQGVQITRPQNETVSLRLTPGRAEIMPAPGSPFPPDNFTSTTEQGERVFRFHHQGQVNVVSNLAQLLGLDRHDWSVTSHAELLDSDPRRGVVLARAFRLPTREEEKSGLAVGTQRYEFWYRNWEERLPWMVERGQRLAKITSTGLLFLDGDRGANLSEKLSLSATSHLWRTSGDFPGLLLAARPLSVPGTTYKPIPGSQTTFWFLDGKSEDIRLEPAPVFKMSDDRRVPLYSVVGWIKPGQAVVGLPHAFYLLTRR